MGISKTAAAQRYLQFIRRIARSRFLFMSMIIFFSRPDQDNRPEFYDIYHKKAVCDNSDPRVRYFRIILPDSRRRPIRHRLPR